LDRDKSSTGFKTPSPQKVNKMISEIFEKQAL